MFACFGAADVYAIYLYLTNVGKPCPKPIALWNLLVGFSGIGVVISLFAIIGLAWNSTGAATPVRKDGECALNVRVGLVIAWGALALFQIAWSVMGSVWVYGTAKASCPAAVYDFAYAFVAAHWALFGLLVALSLIAMFAGGGSVVVPRPDLASDHEPKQS